MTEHLWDLRTTTVFLHKLSLVLFFLALFSLSLLLMLHVYPSHVDLCRLLPANYVCSLLCQDIWPQTTNWNWIIHYIVYVCRNVASTRVLHACVCVLQVDFAFYLFIHFNWIYAVCANAPRAKCCAVMRSCCYFVCLANLHILAWNKCANIRHAPSLPLAPAPFAAAAALAAVFAIGFMQI